ncbi:MAG: sigma-70 family RNA polymerase sigma factor [Candidatus Acidiferrum sp.]
MATMGLALPWEARISSEERERGSRVEASENPATASRVAPAPNDIHAEDIEMAAACRAGEMRGYERLYSLHGKRMKSIARNLLGSASDAEDAVQETFLKVQRRIVTFRGQSSFVTWTFRILINTCYDVRRSRMRKKEVASEGTDESTVPEQRAPGSHPSLKLALERALAKLTDHQRQVFLLYEVEGFRHAEIAEMLEMTETASKNTLFQAKKNLRVMLEPPRSQAVEAR